MLATSIRRLLAVTAKDVRSELRTRYGITALLLFVITAVSLVVFSVADEPLPPPLTVALLWIIMMFTAMTGLGRSFLTEEERGTALFLRINSTPLAVFGGKLLTNILLSVGANVLATLLMLVFVSGFVPGSFAGLIAVVLLGSVGLACVLTIVSAIIAKAGARSPILPVLGFPILVPILLLGTRSMLLSLAGFDLQESLPNLVLMFVYSGLVTIISAFVFEYVWLD